VTVGLSGNLSDFGIADVFQLIGQQRKTGVLELRSDSGRAQLVFDRGLVVSAAPVVGRAGDLDPLAERLIRCGQMTRDRAEEAIAACHASARTLARTFVDRGWLDEDTVSEAEDLVTRDTIFDVLRWQTGSFDFRARDVSHERDRGSLLGAEQILMDGLRMVDEWQSFQSFVPSEDSVFARVGAFERFAGASRLTSEDLERAERLFSLIDGRVTARRVIDLARLGTFDGMRSLSALHQGGAIELVTTEGAPEPSWQVRTSTGRPRLGRLVAGVVPLCALAAVVWWTVASSATPAVTAAYRLERSTLDTLRQDYRMRAARHALEAYRLSRGRWPDRLADLESTHMLDPDVLAALQGRAYYSARGKQGPIFLAPER